MQFSSTKMNGEAAHAQARSLGIQPEELSRGGGGVETLGILPQNVFK